MKLSVGPLREIPPGSKLMCARGLRNNSYYVLNSVMYSFAFIVYIKFLKQVLMILFGAISGCSNDGLIRLRRYLKLLSWPGL